MYNLIYAQMGDAGLARSLSIEEQFWVNCCGDRVETEEEAFVSKIYIDITHPEWILFGDEVGTDINQKGDGQITGTNYCVGTGTRANIKSNTNGRRFTVIGLTAASGDAVMCIIIFAGQELTYEQRMRHDIQVGFNGETSMKDNSGPGKAFPEAPTRHFRGKDVPALVAFSPKGSITSKILREAFQRLDTLGTYTNVYPVGQFPWCFLMHTIADFKFPFFGM
jgi:hypothetical protein